MSEWKMVPVEPTDEMLVSGSEQEWTEDVYRAMLAAAPAPAFDEAAERAAFEEWAHSQWPGAERRQLEIGKDGRYKNAIYRDMLIGWLSCAKRKSGGDL